jgi:S1-C subfamily serine protease
MTNEHDDASSTGPAPFAVPEPVASAEPEGWPEEHDVAPATRRRRPILGLVTGGVALVLVAASVGVVVGHELWPRPSVRFSFGQQSFPNSPFGSFFHQGSGGSFSFGYGSGGGGFTFPGGTFGQQIFSSGGSISSTSDGPTQSQVRDVVSSVTPGLVDISTVSSYSQEAAAGTGMVVSPNGLVVTNNHVIDGATSITVTDLGNHKSYVASVVGYDEAHDVALLQLANAHNLATIQVAEHAASVGEKVIGLGNAGGIGGTPSAAGGAVQQLHQSITATDESSPSGSEELHNLIEMDANIEPGDSGGALVATNGHVLGMDVAAGDTNGQTATGRGFAIPIATVEAIVKYLRDGVQTSTDHLGPTALLGIEVAYNGGQSAAGVKVATLLPNSAAAQAGLATGDTITAVNGQSVTKVTQIVALLRTLHPGDHVKVSFTTTTGATASAPLTLTAGPPQ